MTITAALVLFATIWFIVFFVALQTGVRSQADAGEVLPGTPASAPAEDHVRHKARVTTVIATAIWVLVCGVIISGVITVRDLDVFGRMEPEPPSTGP